MHWPERWKREVRSAVGFTSCCLVLACGDTPDEPNAERGELGRGHFSYDCFGDTDIACDGGSPAFPSSIAFGGRFALDYDPGNGPTPIVVPAARESIAELPGGFRFLRPGYAALLAVDGNRKVQDLIHLRGALIDEVRVSVDGDLAVSTLRIEQGAEHVLSAVPVDEHGVSLAGSLDYEWITEGDDVLDIETLTAVNRVRIRGMALGRTTLVVDVEGESFELPVRVLSQDTLPEQPQPAPEPEAPRDGDSGAPEPEPEPPDLMSDGGAPLAKDAGPELDSLDAGHDAPDSGSRASDAGAQPTTDAGDGGAP